MSITNRTAYAKGSTPTIAVGDVITDAVFGSRITRVTNGATITDLGTTGRSFRTPASGHQLAWNSTGTKFYVCCGDGNTLLFSFNRTTMATARLGGFTGALSAMNWDYTDANILYANGVAANNHTIVKVDCTAIPVTITTLVDLDTVKGDLTSPVTYIGAIDVGGRYLMCTFGGTSQEFHHYAMWYPLDSPGSKKVIDTLTTDVGADVFTIHAAQIDKSGRFIDLEASFVDAPPYTNYIWDTTLDTVTPVTANSGGHKAMGFSARVNSDTLTAYDAIQYILIPNLASPMATRSELVSPLLTPQQIFEADHISWNNARVDSMQPFFASIYRYYDGPNNVPPNKNEVAWRAGDDEIVGMASDGSGTWVRYCHHRTQTWPFVGTAAINFWNVPSVNVDQQGQFAMFTSNWDKSLGFDTAESEDRQDVFIVALVSVTPGAPARRRSRRFC